MGVGLLTFSVSSFEICGEARTAASSYPARNYAYGLLTECLWFFAAKCIPRIKNTKKKQEKEKQYRTRNPPIFARSCSTPLPYFLKYSAATAPDMRGIGGPRFESGDARTATATSAPTGLGRSGNAGLEAESKRAVRIACADECRGVDERGAPRRAVVVHVRDWDA
ncbi:hypothetical protein EDB92DRAFT_177080 [Lactarius akahatsu]|uniref:Uncharacterized protein n=1 Tax=Lactarius akahatsu TaxID=416441 RepID=A0AAD4L7K6_9AGAM|nr:hypothetical protein EDB92DRAFT_177080 [Lactarius akahatsu]